MIDTGVDLDLHDFGRWTVGELLGEGGQGEVWRIEAAGPSGSASGDPAPESRALKWYFERSATPAQRDAIRRLVDRGSPSAAFLWPEVIVDDDEGRFGYLMPLRPPHFRSISDLLLGRIDAPPSLVLRVTIELTHAFLSLHADGLCYRDISFGNIFVEPGTGRILICDNDNVGVDGASTSAVLGTRRFMAPEVIRREATPSAQTDLHSLAVLIFYLLMVHHPLIGAREATARGRDGETLMLGSDPLFIFDPDNDGNRPDPETQPAPIARWELIPLALRTLFIETFTIGLSDPERRTRESVWRAALTRARDDIVVCRSCGEENLTVGGRIERCRWCRATMAPAIRFVSDAGASLVLNRGTMITGHHLRHDYDFDDELGAVVFDESRSRWGIRNVSMHGWRVRGADGRTITLPPGGTVGLFRGATVMIGDRTFRIESD